MLPTLFFLLITVQSTPSSQPPPTSRIEVTLPKEPSPEPKSVTADLIHDLAWPVAALLALVLLKEPLGEIVSAIASRTRKLSVAGVELELSDARDTGRATGPFLEQLRDPSRGMVQDSSGAMQQQIANREPVDFVVVDLEEGRSWLTSRLFILAEMMPRMREVKTIVFVSSTSAGPQRFVGDAPVDRVRWALTQAYPWLEVAFIKAVQQSFNWDPKLMARETNVVMSHSGAIEPNAAISVVSNFIAAIQRNTPPGLGEYGWEDISGGRWERARWIDQPRLLRVLGADLDLRSFQKDAGTSADEVVRRVLRLRDSNFVAGIDNGRFTGLIDRRALLEKIGTKVAEEKE